MRLDAQKPKITIYAVKDMKCWVVEMRRRVFFLCGKREHSPAYDVNLELVDPSFSLPYNDLSGVRLLKDIPLIEHGINCLPAGHDRSYHLSSAHQYANHSELTQKQVRIKVSYNGFISEAKNSRSKTYNDCIDVDFRVPARR